MSGRGGRWQNLAKSCPEKLHSKDTDTRAVHTGIHETQWTTLWSRVQSQVDAVHLVRSIGAIALVPHLHSVKSCLEKSRLMNMGTGYTA